MKRHWDPKGTYDGAVLKEYPHWSLEVSWRQHTLGCFIIFCRREGVRLMSELFHDEAIELREVMFEIEHALQAHPNIKPDHFNYLQLGNAVPALHLHGIPRYEIPRALIGRVWTDTSWGRPPAWSYQYQDRQTIESLRATILPFL